MSAALRIQKALEALAHASDWIVMDNFSKQDVVVCARRLKTGHFEVALILPEHLLQELTDDMSGDVGSSTYYASLPLHPEALKRMGVDLHVYPMSSAADAAEFMAGCRRTECPICQQRFSGAPLEDGVCLGCFATSEVVAPEEPCVICQVENKYELHGKMLVACNRCKKHTCVACRDKQYKANGGRFTCPACRYEYGLASGQGRVRVCWYE
jgi:hypothetical protein